jgi:hypothetical protein
VREYNALAKKHQIRTDSPDAIAFVVGSGYSFWEPFMKWLPVPIPNNPVDLYTACTMERVLADACPFLTYELRYDYHYPPNPKFVHVQTAAHVAGAAHYDQETMWCVHPVYGLWCVFRAVIIFHDVQWEGAVPTPCSTLLSKEEKEKILTLTEQADSESWKNMKTLLAIRDSVALGRDWRYRSPQLEYFYPIKYTKKQLLTRCLAQRLATDLPLEEWRSEISMRVARTLHSAVCLNDTIYLIGGRSSTLLPDMASHSHIYLSDVDFVYIRADGTLSEWFSTLPLPCPSAAHSSLVHEGSIYVFGGRNQHALLSNIWRATPDTQGNIQKWELVGSMPSPMAYHSSLIFQPPSSCPPSTTSFVYLLGGIREISNETETETKYEHLQGVPSDLIYYGIITDTDHIPKWYLSEIRLPTPTHSAQCFLWENRIYITGGSGSAHSISFCSSPLCQSACSPDTAVASVSFTDVRLDGEASGWSPSPYLLKEPVYGHATFLLEDRVVVLGGCKGRTNASDCISFSTLSPYWWTDWHWNNAGLPHPSIYHQLIRHTDRVYLLGGERKGQPLNEVLSLLVKKH